MLDSTKQARVVGRTQNGIGQGDDSRVASRVKKPKPFLLKGILRTSDCTQDEPTTREDAVGFRCEHPLPRTQKVFIPKK